MSWRSSKRVACTRMRCCGAVSTLMRFCAESITKIFKKCLATSWRRWLLLKCMMWMALLTLGMTNFVLSHDRSTVRTQTGSLLAWIQLLTQMMIETRVRIAGRKPFQCSCTDTHLHVYARSARTAVCYIGAINSTFLPGRSWYTMITTAWCKTSQLSESGMKQRMTRHGGRKMHEKRVHLLTIITENPMRAHTCMRPLTSRRHLLLARPSTPSRI